MYNQTPFFKMCAKKEYSFFSEKMKRKRNDANEKTTATTIARNTRARPKARFRDVSSRTRAPRSPLLIEKAPSPSRGSENRYAMWARTHPLGSMRFGKRNRTTHVNIAVRANFGDDHFTFGRTKKSCHREEDEEYLQQRIRIHHVYYTLLNKNK